MKSDLPQLALFGVSGYARSYVRWLESAMEEGRVELKAAVVVNQVEEAETCERLREKGVVLYTNWDQMFADWAGKLDLCLMPLPIHLHEMAAIAAMEAGSNVLLEKPLAGSTAQVAAIREAEERTGCWVAVGYQDFYRPSTERLKTDLVAGRIGALREITWVGLWPRPEAYYRRNNWAGHLEVNGLTVRDSPLNNALAHFLNLSLFWAGPTVAGTSRPAAVEAELFRCNSIESFDTAMVRVQCDTGPLITAAVTHCCETDSPLHMAITGEKGELMWTHQQGARWSDGEEVLLEPARVAFGHMMDAALARLRDPEARVCTREHAETQVQAIEMIHERTSITSISSKYWEDRPSTSGGMIRVMDGIGEDLHGAVRARQMPSQYGLIWATRGGRASQSNAEADLVKGAAVRAIKI